MMTQRKLGRSSLAFFSKSGTLLFWVFVCDLYVMYASLSQQFKCDLALNGFHVPQVLSQVFACVSLSVGMDSSWQYALAIWEHCVATGDKGISGGKFVLKLGGQIIHF